MSSLTLMLAASLLAVDYGWKVLPDGSVEYIIQLEPEVAAALQEGEEIISHVPAEVPAVRRFRIRVGTGPVPKNALPASPNLPNNNSAHPADFSPSRPPATLEANLPDGQREGAASELPERFAGGLDGVPTNASQHSGPLDLPAELGSSFGQPSHQPAASRQRPESSSGDLPKQPSVELPSDPFVLPAVHAGTGPPGTMLPESAEGSSGVREAKGPVEDTPQGASLGTAAGGTFPLGTPQTPSPESGPSDGPAPLQPRDRRARPIPPPADETARGTTGTGRQSGPAGTNMTSDGGIPTAKASATAARPKGTTRPQGQGTGGPAKTTRQEPTNSEHTPPPRPWGALVLCSLLCFASLGANVYLGWLVWDLHRRCRRMALPPSAQRV